MSLFCALLQVYIFIVFARIVLSWFPATSEGAMGGVQSVLYSVTEPVLGPLRRAIPPLRAGGMGIDLSPLVLVIGVQIIQRILCA